MSGKTDQIKGRIKEAAGVLSILTGGRTTKRRLVVALLPLRAGGVAGGGVHGSRSSGSDGR